MEQIRTCRKCRVDLIAGENWSDGQIRCRNYVCRTCMSDAGKKHYKENAARALELQRKRLSDPSKRKRHDELKSAYYAENQHKWAGYRATQKEKEQTIPWHRAGRLITWVRSRAGRRGFDFDLTREWAAEKLAAGVCEATGISFELSKPDDLALHPWAPSVDRIDSAKGYTKDNCRMVVWAFNMAKAGWTDEVVEQMARALLSKR